MTTPIRFIMIGGFLGAGKTTLIANLAKRFQAEGSHVCVVTNDQAAGLVDTRLLQSQGLEVNEVAGSCFCCNFNGLTDAMEEFESRRRPDVILAEPVGSCTDLIATIALPLEQRLGAEFAHSPYAVVLKPSHGLRILAGKKGGFSPKAEYIFRKQVEESELILINRIDELEPEQVSTLKQLLEEQYPGREVMCISARTGENLDSLYTALHRTAKPRSEMMEVDYDIYAEGEAELGWLNATANVATSEAFDLDEFTLSLVDTLRASLQAQAAEPAHLKVLCSSSQSVSVANLVSSDSPTMLSASADSRVTEAQIILNARVCLDPEMLRELSKQTLADVAQQFNARVAIEQLESFRPGRPVPTHRVT